jgi:hypothetical protein
MAVVISWFAVKRAYAANPAGLIPCCSSGDMKLTFFALYAFLMLRVLQCMPFHSWRALPVFCRTHNVEALFLRRLITSEC